MFLEACRRRQIEVVVIVSVVNGAETLGIAFPTSLRVEQAAKR